MTSPTLRPIQPVEPERIAADNGLITAGESIPTTSTTTLKQESIDKYISEISDTVEGVPSFLGSNHGFVVDHDNDGYHTQAPGRKIRSASPSINSVQARRPTPPQPRTSAAPGASLQIVGQQVNLLVDAIEELRKLGLKEVDTELPELVLVGDQSAGKSSLMGAIAEINLPKDMGMCTRCPANIKTSPGETWTCTVSLHEYYQYTNNSSRAPTKLQPFPPWRENEERGLYKRPFKTVFDKSELEEVVRWAQIALLNPNLDYRQFVPGSGTIAQNGLKQGHKHEADFSPNIIAIEISGPRLPALSFYDLPGIFVSAATKEEQYLINVFENIAAKYIMHENALIVLAMTMSNDPGLSRTSAIIKKYKAEKRTIGVLTMPDRLQRGSTHMDFDAILKGAKHPLPRGYFITKQPGPEFVPYMDYHAQAREEEGIYFDSEPPWTGEWRGFRDRCGTAAIQTYLSQEFARLIAQSMPSIDDKIRARAQHVDIQLSHLRELPSDNVQHVVRQCLQEFSDGVRRILEGGHASNEFLSEWTQLSNDFAEAIQIMKPKFVCTDRSDSVVPGVVNQDSDDSGSKMLSPRPPTYKRPIEHPHTPEPKRHSSDQHPRSSVTSSFPRPENEGGTTSTSPVQFRRPNNERRSTSFDPYLSAGYRFMTIAEVRGVIWKHRRPGHPDIVTDAVREEICLTSTWPWNGPLRTLADTTFSLLRSAILRVMERTLGSYKSTDLFRISKRKILEFLAQHQVEQLQALDAFYELEMYKLFTLNEAAFLKYQAEELKILQDARRERRVRCYVQKQAQLAKKSLTEASRLQMERAVTDDRLDPDPFRLEIETAAYVRGYYKIAGLRFSENLCQGILGNLFRRVHKEIPFLLENYLELNTGDSELKCLNLMVEDHGEAAQRAALQEERTKLNHAADRLAKLVQEFRDTSGDMDIDLSYEHDDETMV